MQADGVRAAMTGNVTSVSLTAAFGIVSESSFCMGAL
jgi:hypothetical protein